MSGIFNGIQSLISTIQTLVEGIKLGIQFLINLVKSLFELITLLTTTIENITTLTFTLPPWLIAVATATIGISVLYIILGRDTGK